MVFGCERTQNYGKQVGGTDGKGISDSTVNKASSGKQGKP